MGAVGASAITAQENLKKESTDTGSHLILAAGDDRDITAPKAELVHPKVQVKTTPAPKPKVVEKKKAAAPPAAPPKVAPAPKVVAPPPPPAPKPVVVLPAPKPAPAPAPAPAPKPAPPKVVTPAPVPNGTKAASIAAAALAQLGRAQDCTMLVTNALRSVGVSFHDWPAGYLSLGPTVPASAAVPGDLIYYANGGMGLAHIAVYIGNGVAVHGGWNGNQTVTFSANVGSGPVFIRVA
jgi:cell wall-associated NlpC family hydrolase